MERDCDGHDGGEVGDDGVGGDHGGVMVICLDSGRDSSLARWQILNRERLAIIGMMAMVRGGVVVMITVDRQPSKAPSRTLHALANTMSSHPTERAIMAYASHRT